MADGHCVGQFGHRTCPPLQSILQDRPALDISDAHHFLVWAAWDSPPRTPSGRAQAPCSPLHFPDSFFHNLPLPSPEKLLAA